MRSRKLKILFFILLMPLASRLAPVEAGEAALPKVRFVQSGHTASSWPLYVAQEKKFFEKNGIQLESIVIRGATNTTRAVLSETVPIGRINPDYVITGIEKGAKVRIISGNMDKIPYDFTARPEIKSGADLKGKIIGVSTLTGGTTLMLHEITAKAFKLKETDYKMLVVGTSPERYAALKGGSVHATFMGPPFNIRARQEGFKPLVTFHEILGPIQFTVDFAHQNFLQNNRDHAIKYLKSMIQGTQWLYDPKNKEDAIAIHMKILKSERNVAEQDYKFLVQEFQPFPKNGAVNKVAMDKTMELRSKENDYKGKIPPYTDYVDNSLIEEALKQLGQKL
jgi:ABC-type nitrate/sulfonate/bicarbonate transport system substrate-binding protein